MIKLIQNKKSFKSFYYYKTSPPLEREFPKEYPCIVEHMDDEGIGGSSVWHRITYIPKNLKLDVPSFFSGYILGRKNIH